MSLRSVSSSLADSTLNKVARGKAPPVLRFWAQTVSYTRGTWLRSSSDHTLSHFFRCARRCNDEVVVACFKAVYFCYAYVTSSLLVNTIIIFHSCIRSSGLLRSATIFSLVFLAVVVQWGNIWKFGLKSWLCPFFFTCYNQFCMYLLMYSVNGVIFILFKMCVFLIQCNRE
jgi:hypothetical protein